MNDRNQGLDFLRFIAITSVLLLHAEIISPKMPLPLKEFFRYGWSGVDLFFVLSGFLIGLQAFRTDNQSKFESLRAFWIKRWFRTFPLYFVMLFIYVFIKPELGFPFKNFDISFFFFFQNYLPPQDFVQSWSLCIEEQFYFVFPLLVFFLGIGIRYPVLWLLPMLVSMAFRWNLYRQGFFQSENEIILSNLVRFPFHTHLDGISIGVFLAATFDYWKSFSQNIKRTATLLGVVLIVGTFLKTGSQLVDVSVVYAYTTLSIGFGFLTIGLYNLKIPQPLFYPIHKIALWSYGLYLWNNLMMRVTVKYIPPEKWVIQTVVFFMISLVLSGITYHLIEVNFLKLRQKFL